MRKRSRSVRKKRVKRKQRGGAVPLAAATCAPCMSAAASSSTGILGGLTALLSGTAFASQYRKQSGGRRITQKKRKAKRKSTRKMTRRKRK
tara:strand:+ start:226 stop:498 length:273 start_codon:yes stop_codon:yes gene_type:complete